MSIIILNTGW